MDLSNRPSSTVLSKKSHLLYLEASIDTVEDSFIADNEKYSDDAVDLGAVNLSPVPLTQEKDQLWNSLLERAKVHGYMRESMLMMHSNFWFYHAFLVGKTLSTSTLAEVHQSSLVSKQHLLYLILINKSGLRLKFVMATSKAKWE
ncbi:hypothetical protein EV421DRAFT_1732172 [Armillaria borealis]|uniref:Uncharacterized protein n=1 Tax=Armillaria borealis TaxID=47425 RepID=A0AA39MXK9_9AGAR|nr:hypothetical protein EV421DRAFT_1732172 [Armillaria borealis]